MGVCISRARPAGRLRDAGFTGIDTSLEPAPTTLASEADYREFVTTVIYHPHLERLPSARLKQHFIDRVAGLSAGEDRPFTLDYWRLNISARKTMTHPSIIQPSEHAQDSPHKMGKATIFESPRLLVGLNAFEPGQQQPCTPMPVRTRSITCSKAAVAFCSKVANSR